MHRICINSNIHASNYTPLHLFIDIFFNELPQQDNGEYKRNSIQEWKLIKLWKIGCVRALATAQCLLTMDNEHKYAMSSYTRAASHCDQRWYSCVMWNQGVKWSWCIQGSIQPGPEWTKNNHLTNKNIAKQPSKQPISTNIETKQNKSTNALGINIR